MVEKDMEEPLIRGSVENTAVIVASDLEGTLTSGVAWEAMRSYLMQHGQQQIVRRFMRHNVLDIVRYKFGWLKDERAFKERWILEILALFAGLSKVQMVEVGIWVVTQNLWPKRREAVVEELQSHVANGRHVIIVSGLFEPMLDAFAQKLGVDAMGTPLDYDGDIFTGKVAAPLNVGERKVSRLKQLVRGDNIGVAYGDTKRDIPMLMMSDEPVAVCPDADLRATAVSHQWRIIQSV
jgi:HAD superfamily phosphoserine phosphatase-like hydrolase